jgi:hypothetical protein
MSTMYDKNDQVMIDQVVTVDVVSDKCIDLGAAGVDRTVNTPMCYMIIPKTDAGGDVVATSYKFSAIEDDAATLGSPVVLSSVTVTGSVIKNGTPIVLPLPKACMALRYQGIDVDVTGGTNPTCTFDAFLVPMEQVQVTKASPARPTASYPA